MEGQKAAGVGLQRRDCKYMYYRIYHSTTLVSLRCSIMEVMVRTRYQDHICYKVIMNDAIGM